MIASIYSENGSSGIPEHRYHREEKSLCVFLGRVILSSFEKIEKMSELYNYRLQRSVNRFSIGWTFFLMPSTRQTRSCYLKYAKLPPNTFPPPPTI